MDIRRESLELRGDCRFRLLLIRVAPVLGQSEVHVCHNNFEGFSHWLANKLFDRKLAIWRQGGRKWVHVMYDIVYALQFRPESPNLASIFRLFRLLRDSMSLPW